MPTTVPLSVRRVLTLLAAVSLFVDLHQIWTTVANGSIVLPMIITVGYVVVLVVAALSVITRSSRVMDGLDVSLLVAAIVFRGADFHAVLSRTFLYGDDEGQLGLHAIKTLLAGHDPYSYSYQLPLAGSTPLMGGGTVTKFGYPPLSTLLGGLFGEIYRPLGTPAVICGMGLFATAVFCFVVVPRGLRPVAVVLVLGLDLLTAYALNGYTVMLALPLLCVAFWRWTSTGRSGRLGALGIVQAICLGLAACAQQLAWFAVPFLVLAIWLVRRGELGDRRALAVTARYVLVAFVTFLLPNLPFMINDFSTWATGVGAVLTQHAVIYGQGLVALTYVAIRHSSLLDFYSYATVALVLAFLAITGVGIRRVGYALAVLPGAAFFVSARSEDNYWVLLTPIWLVGALCLDEDLLAGARPLQLPRVLRRRPSREASAADTDGRLLTTPARQAVAVVAAMVPALACVAVAATSPAPLTLRTTQVVLDGTQVTTVTVTAVNHSSHVLSPSFSINTPSRIRAQWKQVYGPARLEPGQSATYVLTPPLILQGTLTSRPTVYALTGEPQTLSSTRLRLARSQIIAERPPHQALQLAKQRCMIGLFTGHRSSCAAAPSGP